MPKFVKQLFLPACIALSFILGYFTTQVPSHNLEQTKVPSFKRGMVYLSLEQKMLPDTRELSERSTLGLISQNKQQAQGPKMACLISPHTYRIVQKRPHPVLEVNKSDLQEVAMCFKKPSHIECKILPMTQASQYPICQHHGRVIYGNL